MVQGAPPVHHPAMRSLIVVAVVVVTVMTGSGCPPPLAPLSIPAGCSPLLHELHCGLPFPSDHFLVEDSALPSGHRVAIDGAAELVTNAGLSADITEFMPQDGFSRHAPIVWTFGVAVDPASVPGISADAAATVAAGFKIALLRANDGARVPFFVDVDPRALEASREALVLRPLIKLDETTRYIVAVSGVTDVEGNSVPVPEGFRRLRDASVGDDPILRPLLDRYEAEVFPLTTTAGIPRSDLQLAWDFTTGSDLHIVGDMARARQLVLEEIARTPPVATVEGFFEGAQLARVFDSQPETSWRFIELRMTGPRVVDGDEAGALLARDEAGAVRLNGTTTFDVSIVIPASVRDGFSAGRALLFGHGFFGTRTEVESASVRRIANASGRAIMAIDCKGMSREDIGITSTSLGDVVSESLRFGERLPQTMMNWITLSEFVAAGGLDTVVAQIGGVDVRPFLRPASGEGTSEQGGVSNAGAPIVDGTDMVHLGISQGHILAGVHTAVNARVRRTVMQVGGAGFTHLMFRARPFAGFLLFLDTTVPDPLDQQLLAAQFQRGFDRFDAAAWSPYVLDQAIPDSPDNGAAGRQVLLQIGRGDSQVPNLGAFLHARYLGIPWVEPSAVSVPFGLTTATAPVVGGSGIYAFDMGIDPSFENTASFPDENFIHNTLQSTPEAVAQMAAFFLDGTIIDPCGSGCGVIDRP